MASVSVEDVRDVLHLGEAEISDTVLSKMIRRAALIVGLELGKEIDAENCTDAEKEAITLLAAIYAVCYLTGGSAVGLSFSIGDKNVSVLDGAPPLTVLQSEFERILSNLRGYYVRRV
ncbi:hypothetical protein H5T51_00730 [Candidatus Bathyarchaeota archaeon]|nr:hypothetical protein [Candidatus Bathyarchaeota archaeon]